ncbi:hypothetical protein QBC34DRAFT_89549 [Podospora aff. communis PSN243]|uniref:Uncharacterized protein n=1 Tax=Podospora aff. communis PSN243 TaxID=3040156 RepID=A0AAV9GMD6_9PEZI|nr:hypothetical protein QBC34DRAFT_89549 [Podospora aff. communis PSN243]
MPFAFFFPRAIQILSQTKIYLSYLSFTKGKANLCPPPACPPHKLPFSAPPPLPALLLLGPGQRKGTGGQETPSALGQRPGLSRGARCVATWKKQFRACLPSRTTTQPRTAPSWAATDNTTHPCRHLQGIFPLCKEVWPEHRRQLKSCSRQETPQVTLTPLANRPSPQPPHTREARLLPIQPHYSLSFQKRCGEKVALGSLLHVHVAPGLIVPVL